MSKQFAWRPSRRIQILFAGKEATHDTEIKRKNH